MGPRREAEKKAKLFSPSMALQMSSSSSSAATSLSFRPSVTSFISNINNNVSFQTSLKPARRFKTIVFIKKSPKRLIYASPRLPKMRYRNWMKHYQFSSQINMRLCGVWEHGLLYIEVDPEGADTWKLDAAVEFLKNGAVGVIPTDTVYAMGLNFVIDAGVRVSNPSTVLDMIQIPPKIIRQGKGPKQQWMVEEDSATEERD